MTLVRVGLGFAGAGIVLVVWHSVIVTIILPRRSPNWLTYSAWLAIFWLIVPVARLITNVRSRDALLAYLAPMTVVALLSFWLIGLVVGFACLFSAFAAVDAPRAFDLAGSSIFTLGFASGGGGWSRALLYAASGSGIFVVALLVGFLPAVYAAYSAREALVTQLAMRCSEDGAISGPLILAYHPLPRAASLLSDLYTAWEFSAASIIESHTNYPWLVVFRSPRATESWLTCMLAVLDSIGILEAAAPNELPASAEHCKYACTMALVVLADLVRPKTLSMPTNGRLDELAFASGLRRAVLPECDVETVWRSFRHQRKSYEPAALELGAFLLRPDDGWLCPAIDTREEGPMRVAAS